MCRAMEEMRNELLRRQLFLTKLEDLIQIMESFNISAHEALKVLDIPESEYDRYIAAI